jgi:hypothetical protein
MYLGDFGTEPTPTEDDITFGYFGRQMRAHPELCELDMVEFLSVAGNQSATDALVKTLAWMCVHPDDFHEFWTLARRMRQQSADIFALCHEIVAAVAERPTGRSSDSSGGPSSTPQSSAGDDFSVAMRANAGRPDRQLAIVRAREAQTA